MADFGAGPVVGADEFAADDAIAVDDVGFGPHVGVEELGGDSVGVAHGDEVDVMAGEEAGVGVGVFVDADGEDGEVWACRGEAARSEGISCNAGRAPGCPEVEQDDLPR